MSVAAGGEEPRHEIIIVRHAHGDHDEAHHGGVWKIAFADFMTAMMCFFLVMWLINAANEQTKAAVASYFNPVKLIDRNSSKKGLEDLGDGPHRGGHGLRGCRGVERKGRRGRARQRRTRDRRRMPPTPTKRIGIRTSICSPIPTRCSPKSPPKPASCRISAPRATAACRPRGRRPAHRAAKPTATPSHRISGRSRWRRSPTPRKASRRCRKPRKAITSKPTPPAAAVPSDAAPLAFHPRPLRWRRWQRKSRSPRPRRPPKKSPSARTASRAPKPSRRPTRSGRNSPRR